MNGFPTSQAVPEIDLREYILVLLNRKWTVVSFTLLGAALAALATFFAPRVYETVSSFAIGTVNGTMVMPQEQLIGQIQSDIYAIPISQALHISETSYPDIIAKAQNNTNLVTLTIQSSSQSRAVDVLNKINEMALRAIDVQTQRQKGKLERSIIFLQDKIADSRDDIQRTREKINLLDRERGLLEQQISLLQQGPASDQGSWTQFAALYTKERVENHRQETIELTARLDQLQIAMRDAQHQIEDLRSQIDEIVPASVTSSPHAYDGPISPRPTMNVTIGIAGGFLFGVFIAFGKEWWQRPLKPRPVQNSLS